MKENDFSKTLQKTLPVKVLLLMMIFVFSSCDMLQDNKTLEKKNILEQNSFSYDFPSTDYNSGSTPVTAPLQSIVLEEISYSVKPFGTKTDIDLVVTLPFEESFTIKPKDNEEELLDIKVANDGEKIVRVDGTTVYPIKAGIATLTVQSSNENHAPMSIQVVVPPKLKLYTELGTGWWYKKIQEDTTLTQEKRDIMLKLYKMILQKPGTAFADGMANVIPIPKGKLSYSQIQTTYWAVKFDYPELFWLKSTFSVHWEGSDYHAITVEGVFSSLEDYTKKTNELEDAANRFILSIDKKLTSSSRDVLDEIYRKLSDIPYEGAALTDSFGVGSNWEIHSSYGALHNNRAVCDGYSSAFSYLVKKLQKEKSILKDVYLSMIVGKPTDYRYKNPGHAWNMVYSDNRWSEIDVTYAKVTGYEKNFMVTNNDRDFVLGHNLDVSYGFIKKYVPFAEERIRRFYDYRK